MFFVAHYIPRQDKAFRETPEVKSYSGMYFDQICRIGAMARHEPEEETAH